MTAETVASCCKEDFANRTFRSMANVETLVAPKLCRLKTSLELVGSVIGFPGIMGS
jgi:hypothetical protein